MADFETELSAMFQSDVDPTVGEGLAEAALARIVRQDQQRSLALTLAGAVGVVIAGTIAGLSGAPEAIREMAMHAASVTPSVSILQLVWPMAALGAGLAAVQWMRANRAL